MSQDLILSAIAILLLPAVLLATRFMLRGESRAGHAADKRAGELLRELLSEEERRNLDQLGSLTVPSPGIPGRAYSIPARPGMVTVYDSGEPAMRLCLQPVEPLPAADVVLMLKLMIEANETEYLRIANVQQFR